MSYSRWLSTLTLPLGLLGCQASGELDERLTPAVMEAALAGTPTDVVVVLAQEPTLSRRVGLRPAWDAPKARLRELALLDGDDRVVEYDALPMVALREATADDLARLTASADVVRIEEAQTFTTQLGTSLGLIGQPTAASGGARGSGIGIAIIDTGVNYAHAAFGSCASAGAPGCAVRAAQDFGSDDGVADADGHGTNVAAISLGVAPDAHILGLDVFNGASASSVDVIAAVNWAVSNKNAHNIQVMNLSLGGGASTAACPSDGIAVALQTARDAGIVAAVASGNNGYTNRVSAPACAPAAVSVGAVYSRSFGGMSWSGCSDATTGADRVTCFSNSASFLSVLAPGALITAGGHTMGGTSQASPHVAGALAVLRAAFPAESITQSVARLTSTGVSITDPRNGVTTPRIALAAAVSAQAPSPTPTPAPTPTPTPPPAADTTPPSGARLVINAGARFATSRSVTLTIGAASAADVAGMCLSNTTSCSSWVAYATTRSWSTASTSGAQTVRLWLRDAAGNVSSPVSASITIDSTAPRNPTLRGTAGVRSVALTWTAATDTGGSGLARYILVGARGTSTPACTATPLYSGTALRYTHSNLTGGTAYSYRVCAVDNAGNRSAGASARVTPRR